MTKTSFAESLADYSLAELMSKNVLTVYEGWSVKRLAGFFVKHGISGAPVIASDDELVGVVTQSDVVRFESREITEAEIKRLSQFYCGPFGGELGDDDLRHMREKANENCTVFSIMTPEVCAVDVATAVVEACQLIVEKHLHRLFVTDKGQLVGVVTARDIMAKLLEEQS
ncbi:CBS domain protein [Alteromonadaceae bacterium 2753L.S.0a.02]|nr:CBS domain protein [Alteromonadaceae bacterium 2753L.S.0a.02]